jgi:hypothetical protein
MLTPPSTGSSVIGLPARRVFTAFFLERVDDEGF